MTVSLYSQDYAVVPVPYSLMAKPLTDQESVPFTLRAVCEDDD